MTWINTASYTATSSADAVDQFFTNHLGNIGSWEVSGQNARLDISANNAGTNPYFYMHNTGDGAIGVLTNTNGAADWTTADTGTTYYPNGWSGSHVSNLKVWTSDQSSNAFMVTGDSGYPLMIWVECSQWTCNGNAFPSGVASSNYFSSQYIGLNVSSNSWYGPPHVDYTASAFSQAAGILPGPVVNHSFSAGEDGISGILIQGFQMSPLFGSTTYPPIGYVTANDVLVNSNEGNTVGYLSDTLFTVTDGTNWWIRTNSDMTRGAFWFGCGTTEPIL